MQTETREIEYQGVRLTVSQASYNMGVRRTALMDQQRKASTDINLEDPDAFAGFYGRVILWPAMIAAVVSQEGFEHWPIAPDELFALPEVFIDQWYSAVYELNPHWKPKEPEATTGPKASNG